LDTIHETSASGTLGGSAITLIDSSGPVGNWHDNQTTGTALPDDSGNANNGTLIGGSVGFAGNTDCFNTVAPSSGGSGGDALSFGNTNSTSYVSVPNSASLNFSGAITLSAWVLATADTGTQDILVHGSISGGTAVYLRINNGNYEVGTYSGGLLHGVSVAAPAGDAGNWSLLTGTYDGTNWKLYDNGTLLGTSASGTGAVTISSNWYIGGNPSDPSLYYKGPNIDEESIYNRALSAGEIAALANIGQYGGVSRAPNTTTLAAANYDYGGEGVGYHSVTTGNYLSTGAPGVYRNDNVSIENTTDTLAGHQPYDITNTQPGEWFAYTVAYGAGPGTLTPTLRVENVVPSGHGTTAEADLIVYGSDGTSQIVRVLLPIGTAWQSVTGPSFTLGAGTDRIVVRMESGSFGFESLSFAQVSSPTLSPPTLLSATPGAGNSIGVTWTPVAGATGYKVHWGITPGTDAPGSPAILSSYASNAYSIAGLTTGTTYHLTVVATNATYPNGNSSTSNQLSEATEASGLTVALDYSAGFVGSSLTPSAAFDPTTNLVFNAPTRGTPFATNDTSPGPYLTASHQLEMGTGSGQDIGWATFKPHGY